MLLGVNYHYFAEEAPTRPHAIFPVTATGFAQQLDALGRAFDFVSRDELVAAVRGGRALPEAACVITFDDGLRSQLEVALPVLVERGIPAVFFVCGLPLVEGRVLDVHKIHAVRERVSDAELGDAIGAAFAAAGRKPPVVDAEAARRTYRYDDHEAARVKFLLNVVLDRRERTELVNRVFASIVDDEAGFSERLYIDADGVRELEAVHAATGAHGYAHLPLGLLSSAAVRADLTRCADVLAGLTGRRTPAVSYPYGSAEAVTRDVAGVAASVGFTIGFTMERAFNLTFADPLLLARLDTNDAAGGRSSLFDVSDGGGLEGAEGLVSGRSRYAAEVAGSAGREPRPTPKVDLS